MINPHCFICNKVYDGELWVPKSLYQGTEYSSGVFSKPCFELYYEKYLGEAPTKEDYEGLDKRLKELQTEGVAPCK